MNYILGTATFDDKYGLANHRQEALFQEPIVLLKTAESLGIQTVDTAPAYGDAERLIGDFNKSHKQFKVHTKLSGESATNPKRALASIRKSVELLSVQKIEVLYFHSAETFLSNPHSENEEIMKAIRDTGLVEKIGVSVYTEAEIERIALQWPQIEVFQVPENILDQRLLNSKTVDNLAKNGKQFIVRSIFLQGLLLMESVDVPKKLTGTIENIETLRRFATVNTLTCLEAAVSYLNLLDWASGFVIGAMSANQLMEILNCKSHVLNRKQLPTPLTYPLIDPRTW